MRTLPLSFTLASVLVAACGGGDDLSTELEGVYAVSTWTRNTADCGAEGPSVLATSDAFFYIKAENFFGGGLINVKTCETAAECQMLARDEETIHIGGFYFDEGSDSAGWKQRGGFAFASAGTCQGNFHDNTMKGPSSGVRIEARSIESKAFPADSDGECSEDKLEQAAAGQPCVELEVLTAVRTGDF